MEAKEWKSWLRRDGKSALRAVLDGTAWLGHLTAAEPEIALCSLMREDRDESETARAFDSGCLSLVNEFRDTLFRKENADFDSRLLKLNDLIAIIRRLLPRRTIFDFHARFDSWSGFFENFVVDEGLDLRREYFRALAFSQHIAAEEGLGPQELMPLWMSICAECGDVGRYDSDYLRVAMIGIGRLPPIRCGEVVANEALAVQGLARWAATQCPDQDSFDMEWLLLQDDFKRDSEFWKERVQTAVAVAENELSERTGDQEATFPLAGWWRRQVGIGSRRKTPKCVARQAEPVPKSEWEPVLRSAGEPLERVGPEMENLIRRQQRYAQVSGDVFYLVRTSCNFGMRLIEKGPEDERVERGRLAVSLAAQAFRHDPSDVFAWSLMRDALVASGRVSDAELVGWESIRRFPEDVQYRTQLATVLADYSAKTEEAESLLRETVDLFPEEPYAFAQLATVLSDDLSRTEDARAVLGESIRKGVANATMRNLLTTLDQGRPLRSFHDLSVSVRDDAKQLHLPSGAARRLLFLFEAGAANEDAIRSFLAGQSYDSYAIYVLERIGRSDMAFDTNFALQFEKAVRKSEPSSLRALISRKRPYLEKALVEEAIAAGEGRVVAMTDLRHGTARSLERIRTLRSTLRQEGGREDRRTRLLRDFAASTLSSGSVVSLMAA